MTEKTIKTEDTRFASEKAGLEVVKSVKEIEDAIQPIPFHKHTGNDGSPKLDLINIVNKEDSEGGNYVDSNEVASTSISGAWATLTDFNASKELIYSRKRFLLIFSGTIQYSGITGCELELRFDVDGTDTSTLASFIDADGELNGDQFVFSIHHITSVLSVATHTFQVEARAVSGSGTLKNTIFSVIELTN